ncbi:hypothetical protein Pan216_42420 [Planctomycetes bacterium Pan216]|uniref:Uncharacterized protein n=1 Tax=Kolteria novifilia TaxID=2527975 RepID=A0A518B8Q5_9BACT|nr:hypothetical protein Pan216_42420 [Planctomycetes bacterium Pan216]
MSAHFKRNGTSSLDVALENARWLLGVLFEFCEDWKATPRPVYCHVIIAFDSNASKVQLQFDSNYRGKGEDNTNSPCVFPRKHIENRCLWRDPPCCRWVIWIGDDETTSGRELTDRAQFRLIVRI